jgi:hypothetical protein
MKKEVEVFMCKMILFLIPTVCLSCKININYNTVVLNTQSADHMLPTSHFDVARNEYLFLQQF